MIINEKLQSRLQQVMQTTKSVYPIALEEIIKTSPEYNTDKYSKYIVIHSHVPYVNPFHKQGHEPLFLHTFPIKETLIPKDQVETMDLSCLFDLSNCLQQFGFYYETALGNLFTFRGLVPTLEQWLRENVKDPNYCFTVHLRDRINKGKGFTIRIDYLATGLSYDIRFNDYTRTILERSYGQIIKGMMFVNPKYKEV